MSSRTKQRLVRLELVLRAQMLSLLYGLCWLSLVPVMVYLFSVSLRMFLASIAVVSRNSICRLLSAALRIRSVGIPWRQSEAEANSTHHNYGRMCNQGSSRRLRGERHLLRQSSGRHFVDLASCSASLVPLWKADTTARPKTVMIDLLPKTAGRIV